MPHCRSRSPQAPQPRDFASNIIKVELEAAADYLQKLQTELASGTGSNVAFTAMGSFRVLAEQGGLLELDPFMARNFKKGD